MNKENLNIAVFGGGSWATAIIKMLCESSANIFWYVRKEQTKIFIKKNKHNPNYLSSIELHTDRLNITNDMDEVAKVCDILIFAIPSVYIYTELQKLSVDLSEKLVFSAIKGIVPETALLVGDHFHRKYNLSIDNIGVISGPCHAEEVALERLSYLTIACRKKKNAKILSELLISDFIKVKLSKDVVGIEYATMLKNVYAIAAGIAHGLGYGDNFQSVLMSNSIREMKRFVKMFNSGKKCDVKNSAYLGDLLVTGYSTFSRNRMFGNMIGKGYTVKSAIMEMTMITEGYYATKCAYDLIKDKHKIFPIIETVYSILYEKKSPKKIMKILTENVD